MSGEFVFAVAFCFGETTSVVGDYECWLGVDVSRGSSARDGARDADGADDCDGGGCTGGGDGCAGYGFGFDAVAFASC